MVYDKTSLGDKARRHTMTPPQKGDVDVFPRQLTMKCGSFEIQAGQGPADTKIFIDGKEARGIYSLKLYLNTQRLTKIELGVFMDEFKFNNFNERPRR
jgi:hypothetical protein